MTKREHLRELRDWATDREQAERDKRTIVSVCANCGHVRGTVPSGMASGGFSHGIGHVCASILYPELKL